MMGIIISPETTVLEGRPINLILPKFLWQAIEARAKAIFDGNLEITLQTLILEELLEWFQQASTAIVPLPALSPN